MSHGIFVTGTDTGVGKTLIACALMEVLRGGGLRVAGMKPVAAGCEEGLGGLLNRDVEAIKAHAGVGAATELVNPYCFYAAVAPHIAAAWEGVVIELSRIQEAFRALALNADIVVVEGVGGFRVPLSAGKDTADLAIGLGLPVLIVVGMRLGCLNHAALTLAAVRAAGLPLAGWVANRIDGAMVAFDENLAALVAIFGVPPVGVVPLLADPRPEIAASALESTQVFRMCLTEIER